MDDGARLEALVRQVCEGQSEASELAEGMGVGMVELGRIVKSGELAEAVRGLRLLADLRAQMVVSRYRMNAAAKLVELAHGGSSDEISRKACVDLLKLDVAGAGDAVLDSIGGRVDVDDLTDYADASPDESKLLAALEAIAAECDDDFDDVDGGEF